MSATIQHHCSLQVSEFLPPAEHISSRTDKHHEDKFNILALFSLAWSTLNTTTPPTKNTLLQISKSMLNNLSTWQETMLNALADVQAKGGESRGWWLQHVHSCKFHGGSWQHVRDFVHVEFLQGSWTVHAPWLEGSCKVHEPACYTWNAPTLKNAIFQNVFKIEFELISRELAY